MSTCVSGMHTCKADVIRRTYLSSYKLLLSFSPSRRYINVKYLSFSLFLLLILLYIYKQQGMHTYVFLRLTRVIIISLSDEREKERSTKTCVASILWRLWEGTSTERTWQIAYQHSFREREKERISKISHVKSPRSCVIIIHFTLHYLLTSSHLIFSIGKIY